MKLLQMMLTTKAMHLLYLLVVYLRGDGDVRDYVLDALHIA
jgi:hypothetical protein